MLKSLNKNNTLVSPFTVTKNWELSNTTNDDLVIMEYSGSDGLPVALEYIDYETMLPVTSSNCNIALDQQYLDKATLKQGLNIGGFFYPNTDPVNLDGTYQRMIYSQIINMFYNDYRDPTKIWGLENLDFELSQTKKFIADQFTLFDIPKNVFGEKIIPNTFIMYDSTTDNNYVILDDGNCNLFAGTNLFSYQQELGEYTNQYNYEATSSYCNIYNTISPPDTPLFTSAVYTLSIPSIYLSWNINEWPVTYYVLEKSTDGVNYILLGNLSGSATSYTDNNVSNAGNVQYWYQLYAVNLLGTSSISTINVSNQGFILTTWNNMTSSYWSQLLSVPWIFMKPATISTTWNNMTSSYWVEETSPQWNLLTS